MVIVIDYDNDCVRMSEGKAEIKYEIDVHQPLEKLVYEMINMICDGNDHPQISLMKQDDGTVSTIEEW